MRTSHARDGQEWQKSVAGGVNAMTLDAQRLGASVTTSGAIAQLKLSAQSAYMAVYTLDAPSPQRFDIPSSQSHAPSPTVQIYLSTDGRECDKRSYMLVQRLSVPAPAPKSVPKEESTTDPSADSSAPTARAGSAAEHRKALCVSKMYWAGASALALLRADGHLLVLATGISPVCLDAELSSSETDDDLATAAPSGGASRPLFEAHRVVDMSVTTVERGARQWAVVLAAHHTHTAVTVVDVTRTPSHGAPLLQTVTWPSIGPFRGVVAVPPLSSSSSSFVSPCSVVFAGDDANGCLSVFEWSIPEDFLSSSDAPAASTPPLLPPRCLRQCMLGPEVVVLGLVTESLSSAVTNEAHVALVGLKTYESSAPNAPPSPDRARLGQDPADALHVLRGKNGAPLVFDASAMARLREADAQGRDPLNQVYAMLQRQHSDSAPSPLSPPPPTSIKTLAQLSALRIVRPRLSLDTLKHTALSVLVGCVQMTAQGASVVNMEEHTLPLERHHDAFAVLFAGAKAGPASALTVSSSGEVGIFLHPFFLAHSNDDGVASGFVLHNARGLVSALLPSPPSPPSPLSPVDATVVSPVRVPHVWCASPPDPQGHGGGDTFIGGVTDLWLDSQNQLRGVVLGGPAYEPSAVPDGAEEADVESVDDFYAALAREAMVVGQLTLHGVTCESQSPASQAAGHDPDSCSGGAALAHTTTEALVRRVVREELATALAPMEDRLSRMENMLQIILNRLS